MCGRYSDHLPPDEIARVFRLDTTPNLPARYNVAPTQPVPVVRLSADGRRELVQLRWGLIPAWAKDSSIGNKLINARAETVATKPSFRDAFAKRRCLVITSGFYEWQKTTSPKQPWHITLKDGKPFGFAGLWERWREPTQGEVIETTTIVTGDANELVAPIHNRMPVIIDEADHDVWLDPVTPRERLLALLRRYPADRMHAFPVSTRVNSVRNDEAAVLEPLV